MKIFVPGRICLFGEHTDWAGGYRRINNEIEKGYAIITGTNQGLYAEVKAHPKKLIYKAASNENGSRKVFEIDMDRKALLAEAEKGGFFSYIAGVAYRILTHYQVQGLEIDNYATDLPIKKGLSSSASVCVLVARAFNKTYNLKMTTRGEMEIAYSGEITTPSRCGRMDQGCAYGRKPVLMVFDGDLVEVHEIKISKPLYFIVVDLMAGKDTREILKKLNQCYPFAENEIHKKVLEYLGKTSPGITHEAVNAIERGDAERIGALMRAAQRGFDEFVAPACPKELASPLLHRVLNFEPIQQYVYGGKGVGSQGDGSAQFIAKDRESQCKAIEIISRDLRLSCLELEIKALQQVKKAVVPAAGYSTRLFPATKAIKKEFFPILDKEGRMKPTIQLIVEEALSADIEEICIIVQQGGRETFEDYFKNRLSPPHYNKLSKPDKEYYEYILDLGNRITFIEQESQDGFGHAVYHAKKWIDEEPFLLLLGDHLFSSDVEDSCAKQLINIYEKIGKTVVGVLPTHVSHIRHFGCVAGDWMEQNLLSITEFVEKPEVDYAKENLQIEGYGEETFLTLSGQYIITPGIFHYLEENIRCNFRESGEFQLTSCLERLRQEENAFAYVLSGKRFDIGNPYGYKNTMMEFGRLPETRPESLTGVSPSPAAATKHV